MKFQCAQRGCVFDAEVAPENCPVCNNPFIILHAPKTEPAPAPIEGLDYDESDPEPD